MEMHVSSLRRKPLKGYAVTYSKSINRGLLQLLYDQPFHHRSKGSWFRWISLDYRVTLGFGSIAGGLDHVNPVIRLPIEQGISSGTFSVNKNEDAHDHVDRVLKIVSLFNIPGVSQEAVLLCVFPFTLIGFAKRWVDRLTPGAVNTWDLLKKPLSKGPIPGMTPTQALTAIQTTADHSQKWYDRTSSRNVSSNNNTDGLAVIISKLDSLGRDMKKLKENVHAIQVGCLIYEGPHLDKECHLNEEVKQVEEVKYGEFGCLAPFNGCNGAKFRVGSPGYYTRTDNQPPYREKRLSLEELMNKHQEESARRSTQMDEWIKKLQENSRTTNRAPSSSTGQCKVVSVDHEKLNIPISSSKLNNLHGVSFLSDFDSQVAQNNKERTTEVLRCKLPPKEQNPGNFTLPCNIGDFNFYAMSDLGASVNVMPRGIFEFLKLTNLRKTNMLIEMDDMMKKAPLGMVENVIVGIDKFLFPFDFVNFTWDSCPPGNPSSESLKTDNLQDRQEQQVKKKLRLDEYITVKQFCKPIMQTYNGKVFDLEIEQLADGYELRIRKKGHILDMIWENYKNIQGSSS
ncbi:hypothetical protein Tco_1104829 [Tanacetum coccineum]